MNKVWTGLWSLTTRWRDVTSRGSSSEQIWAGLLSLPEGVSWAGLGVVSVGESGLAYPCMVRSKASWVKVTWDPPVNRMTDCRTGTIENITFFYFCWRSVTRALTTTKELSGLTHCCIIGVFASRRRSWYLFRRVSFVQSKVLNTSNVVIFSYLGGPVMRK